MQNLPELIKLLEDYKPKAIARDTGLSPQTVYNVLNGSEPNPKTATVVALHKFLASKQVDIGRFLEP